MPDIYTSRIHALAPNSFVNADGGKVTKKEGRDSKETGRKRRKK